MPRIHICLVSAQPIPNLIPLKMEELRPGKVINLVSPDMQVRAGRLKKIANEWGISVEEKQISPYDLASARDTCLSLLAEHEDDDVVLNVTGGTKLMALAAFEVFREGDRQIIYVDTQNEMVQVISPEPHTIPFRSLIKVKPYLAAYGQTIKYDRTYREMVSQNKQVVDTLVKNSPKYESAISIMNGYAAPLRVKRIFPQGKPIDDRHREIPEFMELILLLEDKKILCLQEGKIVFPELSAVEFLSGGWLEEHVFDVVSSIPYSDARMGVKVEWGQSGSTPTTNEYDVVFTRNNRLYLIECKTKRFAGSDLEGSTEDLIYKLESLKDAAGGLYGKGMLVSYRKLTDAQKRRLKLNGIEYCDGLELKNLQAKLKAWVK